MVVDPAPNFLGGGVAGNFTAAPAGLVIDAGTGVIDLSASTPNTYTVTNTIAAAAGCPDVIETADHTVTITPSVETPVFLLGATSTRCQGAGSVTYTATAANSTSITYSLDAASITGGVTINASTGEVTYPAGWFGTTVITASAAGCNGPLTADHNVTISPTSPSPSPSQPILRE